MVQDPPFLRQDLVVCRNVLIYFGPELQGSLLPAFHHVLHPGALLFLGQAESVGTHSVLWDTVSATSKIFRASGAVTRSIPRANRSAEPSWQPTAIDQRPTATSNRRVQADLEDLVAEQLERLLSPNVIVIDADDQIVYSHGEANPLLQRRAGRVSDSVFANLQPDIAVEHAHGIPPTPLGRRHRRHRLPQCPDRTGPLLGEARPRRSCVRSPSATWWW